MGRIIMETYASKTEVANQDAVVLAEAQAYTDEKIAAVGAGLPAVTTANNGQFLQVVNGAWAAATIPSAEGVTFGE